MDLDALLATFPPDGALPGTGKTTGLPAEVAPLVAALGGVSLAGGLYRVLAVGGVAAWTATAHLAFPQLRSTTVFAADWLGRLFAADMARLDRAGMSMVVMLEPGTGEALELPVNVADLHAAELLEAPEAALAESFYNEWRAASGDDVPLQLEECVGYRVPLFLGAGDRVDNLERTDMDIYWMWSNQMRVQSRESPVGTLITQASLKEDRSRRLFRRRG